jgi:peptide/nickel transport system permease protein
MQIIQYLIGRFLIALATMLGVSIVIFTAVRMVPGGFEQVVLGPLATPESRAVIVAKFALDRSITEQYGHWLTAAAHGDFGISMVTQTSVTQELIRRAPATIQLALMSLLMALSIGLPLGIISGLTNGRPWQRSLGRFLGALGASIPDFVLGSVFLFVFTVWSLGPTIGGYVPFFEDPWTNLRAMVLPAVTLAVFGIALILRTARDAVKTVMTEGYIAFAVACGEPTSKIIRHHVLRNAAVPIITVTATYLGYLLGGAIVVEVLFSIPGVGLYTYNGLMNRDYAVVQAGVLVAAAVFITINMIADTIYTLLDPRLSAQKRAI